MSLVVIVPMLGRPHWVAPLVESVQSTCDGRVLFMLTPGDDDVLAAVKDSGCDWLSVEFQPGDYQRKINTGIKDSTEEHIFTGAGDLKFRHGWYEAAVAKLEPGIGVVGTNDMCNRRVMRGEHATHMLVTRAYVEEFGTIDEPGKFFHEGYMHEWCDDEAVETAKSRKAWAFARDSIVEHWHPMSGRNPMDPIYAQQADRIAASRPLYMERRKLWR